jgi:hypothetical protein
VVTPRVGDGFVRGISRAEDQVVSFMLWKLVRWLPKPVLFVLLFFLLGAVARAQV